MDGADIIYGVKQGFSISSLLTFCFQKFSAVGAVLGTAGGLAASLASTY